MSRGAVINTATVTGGGDASPGNNTADDPTTILPTAQIPALSPVGQALVVLVIFLSGLLFLQRRLSPTG